MRCNFHVCGSSVILLAVAFPLTAETIINVGSIDVLPDLDGQVIEIIAEVPAGGIADAVTGLNLRVRIGDGMGPIVEPTFSMTAGSGRGVDFTGGIWDGMPSTTIGSVVAEAPQFLQASIVFNAEATTVPAIGKIATLFIDTTGIQEGSFALQLASTGEIGVPTEFIRPGMGSTEPLQVTIIDGSLNVVPEPSAALLAMLGFCCCLCLRHGLCKRRSID